jgi:hypothetical protein
MGTFHNYKPKACHHPSSCTAQQIQEFKLLQQEIQLLVEALALGPLPLPDHALVQTAIRELPLPEALLRSKS